MANRFASDKDVLALIDGITGQFKRGSGKNPFQHTALPLGGRSAMLDVRGEMDATKGFPLDLKYRMTDQEWRLVLQTNLSYE
jgi:hypothetical protein